MKESSMPSEGQVSLGEGGNDFGLTPFEKQAIALSVAGYTHQESMEWLGISQQDLRLQLEGVSSKLRVSNQFELLLFAVYHQLIEISAGPESSESAHEIELTISNALPIQQT
jgi:DNA-binding CsgD family transcriptional regulator